MTVLNVQIGIAIISIIMLLLPGNGWLTEISKRIWAFNLGMSCIIITIWFAPPSWIQERINVSKSNKVIQEVLKDCEQNQLKEKTK